MISKVENKKWAEFVLSHPKGNIFQSPEMYEIYKKTKNYEPFFISTVDESGKLVGVILAVIQKEHKGFLGKFSSRSIIIGGPIVKDDNPEVMDILLKKYNKQIKGKAIYSQFRNMFDQHDMRSIFEINGFKYEAHLDILINLNTSVDRLKARIQRGKRRNFTKSKNKGAKFKEITSLNEFKEGLILIESTYNRVKLPMPDFTFFISAFNELKDSSAIKAFGVYFEDKMIAFRVSLIYKNLVYDWFAGADDKYRSMYSNDYLIYNILLWGVDQKYETFDFGGAGKPNVPYGVRDHKMKFGGELVEFGRFEAIHNKLMFKIAKLGLKLIQKLK